MCSNIIVRDWTTYLSRGLGRTLDARGTAERWFLQTKQLQMTLELIPWLIGEFPTASRLLPRLGSVA